VISGEGDVKKLQGDHADKLRLPIGDYRVFFRPDGGIVRVLRSRTAKRLTAEE